MVCGFRLSAAHPSVDRSRPDGPLRPRAPTPRTHTRGTTPPGRAGRPLARPEARILAERADDRDPEGCRRFEESLMRGEQLEDHEGAAATAMQSGRSRSLSPAATASLGGDGLGAPQARPRETRGQAGADWWSRAEASRRYHWHGGMSGCEDVIGGGLRSGD